MRAQEVVGLPAGPLQKGKITGLPGLVGPRIHFRFLPCVLG